MEFYTLNALCVLALGLSVAGEFTLPFTTCKRDSTNYSSCLKRAITEAWPRFVKGLPEYNFPSLDPFLYGDYHSIYDTNEIHGDVTISSMTITGFSNTRFTGVRTHFLPNNVFRLEVDVKIPLLFNEGDMEARGTLLNTFTMGGKGYYNVTIGNLRTTWDITGYVANDTLVVEHYRTFPEVETMKIYSRGFFNDDQALNDAIMNLVNEFWPLLYRVMLPITVKEWDPRLTSVINNFFSKVPFSKVFP